MEAFCLNELVQDVLTDICFDFFKVAELERLTCSHCGEHCRKYVEKAGLDIYGQKIDNHDANGELVECPVCKKSVAAARFAPHLEKCLGMGRSARTKRTGNKTVLDAEASNNDDKNVDSEDHADDDIHDGSDSRPKRRRKSVSSVSSQKN